MYHCVALIQPFNLPDNLMWEILADNTCFKTDRPEIIKIK